MKAPETSPLFIDAMSRIKAPEPDAKPRVLGGRFYPSDMGKCARALAFRYMGVGTPGFDNSTEHNFGVGTAVHEYIQRGIARVLPDSSIVEIEKEVTISDPPTHGYIDILWEDIDGVREVVDLKTSASFGVKLMLTGKEGPKISDILQVATYVHATGAVRGRLVYMLKERLSKRDAAVAGTDPVVEFVFTAEELAPLWEAESVRLRRVAEFVDSGRVGDIPAFIPGSGMPDGSRIVDPATSYWEHWVRGDDGEARLMDSGEAKFPGCNYCSFQETCNERYGIN